MARLRLPGVLRGAGRTALTSLGSLVLAFSVGGFVVGQAFSERPTGLPGATEALPTPGAALAVPTVPSIPATGGTGQTSFRAPQPRAIAQVANALDLSVRGEIPVTGGLTEVIRRYFGDLTVEAIVIVQCESAFRPDAVGTNTNGTQDHGLFQINDVHTAAFEVVTGRSWDDRYDPEINTAFAAWLYSHSGGWGPWRCNRNLVSFDEPPDDAPEDPAPSRDEGETDAAAG